MKKYYKKNYFKKKNIRPLFVVSGQDFLRAGLYSRPQSWYSFSGYVLVPFVPLVHLGIYVSCVLLLSIGILYLYLNSFPPLFVYSLIY